MCSRHSRYWEMRKKLQDRKKKKSVLMEPTLEKQSREGVRRAGAILNKAVKCKIYFEERRVILCCLLVQAVQNLELITSVLDQHANYGLWL